MNIVGVSVTAMSFFEGEPLEPHLNGHQPHCIFNGHVVSHLLLWLVLIIETSIDSGNGVATEQIVILLIGIDYVHIDALTLNLQQHLRPIDLTIPEMPHNVDAIVLQVTKQRPHR